MVTKKTLVQIAKQKGIKGVSKMRKDEIQELLDEFAEEPWKIQAARQWGKK